MGRNFAKINGMQCGKEIVKMSIILKAWACGLLSKLCGKNTPIVQ